MQDNMKTQKKPKKKLNTQQQKTQKKERELVRLSKKAEEFRQSLMIPIIEPMDKMAQNDIKNTLYNI
jgi:peptidoglycan hydrolase CwlO-like protein